jgi:hypothetical protein
MEARRARLPALLFCLAVLLLPAPAAEASQSVSLVKLAIDNQAGSLMARFGVEVRGSREMAANLKDGVVLGLSCHALLEATRGWLPARVLAENELTCRLRQDPLSLEYALTLPGREAPLTDKSLEALLAKGLAELRIDLGPWSRLEQGKSYRVTVTVRLKHLDVPNWFLRTLFFWTWDIVPKAVQKLEFTH